MIIYAQLIAFLIVVLHVGLGPDVVILVPPWRLSDTPRSAQLWGWEVLLPGVVLFTCWWGKHNVLAPFQYAGLTRFQEVSPVLPVLSVAYFDEVASVI